MHLSVKFCYDKGVDAPYEVKMQFKEVESFHFHFAGLHLLQVFLKGEDHR